MGRQRRDQRNSVWDEVEGDAEGVAGMARTAGIVVTMLGVRASLTAHRVALRATGLLAVMVGLCAVHGLETHASMMSADSMSPGIVRAAHAMVPPDTMSDAGLLGGARGGDVGGAASAGTRDSVGRGIPAMVLCLVLVVLGVGAAAWWTRRRGRRRLRWAWPSQRGMLRTRGRVPAPPSPIALSVCRC